MRVAIVVGLTLLGVAAPLAAQTTVPTTATRGRPGPFVIDVRGATLSVPAAAEFYPTLPAGTVVPARGFGLDAGAHVYPFRLGPAQIGLGLSFTLVRARANTPAHAPVTTTSTTTSTSSSSSSSTSSGATASTTVGAIDVSATARLLAPQVSFNFGSGSGWSYLSAGYGSASISSDASGEGVPATSEPSRDSGRLRAMNIGGGARWFLTRHIGVGFDLRIHRMAAKTVAAVSLPASSKFAASVGFSLK